MGRRHFMWKVIRKLARRRGRALEKMLQQLVLAPDEKAIRGIRDASVLDISQNLRHSK